MVPSVPSADTIVIIALHTLKRIVGVNPPVQLESMNL